MASPERRTRRQQLRDLEANGHIAAALTAVRQALVVDAEDAHAHLTLGRLLGSLSRFAEAEAALMRAQELLHEDEAYAAELELGELYLAWGRFDDARLAFEQLVALGACLERAQCGLGSLLRAQEQLEEAKRAFEACLVLDPAHAEAKRALVDLTLALELA